MAPALKVLPEEFEYALQESEKLLNEAQDMDEIDLISEIYILHRLGNLALLHGEMEIAQCRYDDAHIGASVSPSSPQCFQEVGKFTCTNGDG